MTENMQIKNGTWIKREKRMQLKTEDKRQSKRTRKQADIAFARQIAMYIAHVRLGLNLGEVGRVFQRDRTTVGHACRLIEDRRDDEQVDFLINCLERAVEEWLQIAHHRPCEITSGVENERS